jgi:hypothetical protein
MLKKIAISTAKALSDFTSAIFNFASTVYNFIENIYNFLENLFYSVFSLVRMGVLMAFEALLMPAIFYFLSNSLVEMAGANHWLGSWIIEASKKAVIGLLTGGEQLPLVGVMFTPAVLPWVIYAGIGKLIYSHFKQMWSEQNKIIYQQTKHLDPAQQPNGWWAYSVIYVQIFCTPAQKEKAYAMRLLLSVCVPTFLFLFRSFCGVNPATALMHSGVFSLVVNFVPYGLVGVVAEGANFVTGLIQRWQRVPAVPEAEPGPQRLNNPEPLQFTRQPQLQQPEQQQGQPQLQQQALALAANGPIVQAQPSQPMAPALTTAGSNALNLAQPTPVVFTRHEAPQLQNPALSTPRPFVEGVKIPVEQKAEANKTARAGL